MKSYLFCIFFIVLILPNCAQNKLDRNRYYAILDYITNHQSEINKRLKQNATNWFLDNKKIYVCTSTTKVERYIISKDDYFRSYDSQEILDIYMNYFFNDYVVDTTFVNEINCYLDSIFRKGKFINLQKEYICLSFSDSFYNYTSVSITCKNFQRKSRYRIMPSPILILDFNFEADNRIKSVSYVFAQNENL